MDRQLLSRATDSSNAPTPGYMYIDIAKNAAGNPQTCADVAKYLTGRLASKNNPNVKFKCLKVITQTATSPYLRGQFKRCLSQDPQAMAAIKEATQFRGRPDPVRGDEPFEKVRRAAKDALDAVYSDTPAADPSVGGGGSFASSVSNSYGNPASAGGYGGGPPGGGPRRMEGIGNPMFKDPRLEPEQGIGSMSVNEIMSETKATIIGMINDPLARNMSVQINNNQGTMPRPGGTYSGPGGSFNSPPPGRSNLMNETNGQWTMASNRGPSAVAPPPNYANDAAYYKSRNAAGSGQSYSWAHANSGNAISGGVGGSWGAASTSNPNAHQATPSITVNTVPGMGAGVSGGAGVGVSDGSYERQLVMELCPPGGMKPEPPPDKLAQFARVVASLNPDFICPVILDCLEDGQPWIIRAKALWVMEICIKHGKKPGAPNNSYADFLHACNGEFAPLVIHSRGAIRDPAKRVLNLLGVATPVGGAPIRPVRNVAAAAPAAAPPAPVANLLDFDVPAPAPAPAAPPVAPPAAPPTSNAGGSLFGGLSMAPSKAAAPVAAAPVAAAPAPAAENNLLDLMSGSAAAPAAASSFGFMNANIAAPTPPVAAAANETADMFGNLSLKGDSEPKAPAPSVMAPAAAAGSAFGFINTTTSTDEAAPAAAPVTSPVGAADSFDPLKNVTPNTQKKMMAISPEQMQAMMYQQMMMQPQQMRIAQMQMAQMQMAMQQQLGSTSPHAQMSYMNMPGHVMQNPAASKSTFAFMDKPQKQDDKSFDFVKDAMKSEK